MRTVNTTRYVTPLREGGSLPAIIEADDDGMYVLKFRGAGQGTKALIAELIAGELARAANFLIPELVFVALDPEIARTEPDPEIQDLIRASGGLNLGLDYLPGSVGFDPIVDPLDPTLAARILWFDALVQNVDRSPRNTNLLVWHERLWLIDHGAALYFHHDWPGRKGSALEVAAQRPYAAARDHVLLPLSGSAALADAVLPSLLTREALREVVMLIPDEWLRDEPGFESPQEVRSAYVDYLSARLAEPRAWAQALEEAREQAV